MEQNADESFPQTISITLAFVSEDKDEVDPATINEVALRVVADLQGDGYTVEPAYTGRKGGVELLFQVVTAVVQFSETLGGDVLAQKDTIGAISGLCGIFATVRPLVQRLFHAHKKQAGQAHVVQEDHELKVIMKIDGGEVEIRSSSMADDERILQLAKRFHEQFPTAKVTPHTKVEVSRPVPRRKAQRKSQRGRPHA